MPELSNDSFAGKYHGHVIISRPAPPLPPPVVVEEGQLPPEQTENERRGDSYDHELYVAADPDNKFSLKTSGPSLGSFESLGRAIQAARERKGLTTADWHSEGEE